MSFGPNPWQQVSWDWRAAGNFIGGGAGTGLLVASALFAAPDAANAWIQSWLLFAGLMAAITLGAGLVGVAEAQTPAVQPAETARNTARDTELAAGEIIVAVTSEPNGNAGLVQATIDIAVPPSRLWALLLDCSLSLKLNEPAAAATHFLRAADGSDASTNGCVSVSLRHSGACAER